ncbi:hypothetical protein [Streptomyces sp. A5-4]|uniref:hypothetical protein n=1 Tax=Streptomyces sp. A5-4 TaxID=3384771 RepID=UPI003DA9FBC5
MPTRRHPLVPAHLIRLDVVASGNSQRRPEAQLTHHPAYRAPSHISTAPRGRVFTHAKDTAMTSLRPPLPETRPPALTGERGGTPD